MESVFDLPAHPLFVHTPLVLMPLLALAVLAVAIRPGWRRSFGPLLIVASLALVVVTILATESGEAFDEVLDKQGIEIDIEDHQALGEATRLLVIVFAGLLVASSVVALMGPSRPGRSRSASRGPRGALGAVGHALAAATVLVGVLASVWMFRTGHEGAKVVWDGTIPTEESGED